jgi:glycosyltransferase involved in cell wall biosynthesis
MLSIIICCRNKSITRELADNIKNTVGVSYEIISIDNSKNTYSICSAYNAGFAKSKYPYLCFVHEDVLFHTQNWGQKLITHLKLDEAGIIGLAGGDLVTRIPTSWDKLRPSINIIQSDKSGKKTTQKMKYPENFDQLRRCVILLDGVILCMRKKVMEETMFNETLKGFHGYDLDISMHSTIIGYINYVIYDIELEHFSRGKMNAAYYENLISIFKRWEMHLPLIGKSISEKELSQIDYFEKKWLYKLTKKMIRKGFSSKKIIQETFYFANKIRSEKTINRLKYIRLYIFLVRLFYKPHYLLKSKQY